MPSGREAAMLRAGKCKFRYCNGKERKERGVVEEKGSRRPTSGNQKAVGEILGRLDLSGVEKSQRRNKKIHPSSPLEVLGLGYLVALESGR